MIEVKNLTKSYNGNTVVDNISFTVAKGEMLVLLGTSGSGKTTTLKMLNRLIEPDEGTVLINGEDIRSMPVELLRKHTGYVIQQSGLFPHYTISENIRLVPELLKWPKDKTDQKVNELMHMLKLPLTMLDVYPDELSGGQRQRVGLARALAADPPLVLLDEPFGALDPVTRQHLQDEFIQLEHLLAKTMVMVTHDVGEAVKLGNKICLMSEGKIVQTGSAHDLLFNPTNDFVKEFFNSQRFMLAMQVIKLNDLQNLLGSELKETREAVSSNLSIKAFMERSRQNGNSRFAIKSPENQVLYTATSSEILEAFYQKYH